MRNTYSARCAATLLTFMSLSLHAMTANADIMTFGAGKDATLIESLTGSLSSGGEDGLFVGRTNQFSGSIRRGLIAFDLSAIPTGATINSVSLRMTVVKSQSSPPANTIGLHSLLGTWSEGTVNPAGDGGGGGTAGTGDATWIHQSRPGDLWTTPGGDFVATASGQQSAGGQGAVVTWASTALMVEDVQRWVDDPAMNFGWLLRGTEAVGGSARKLGSRTAAVPNNRPLLTVDFSLPPMRIPGDINKDGAVNAADAALLAGNYGATTTANNFDLGDFSGDGLIGVADMAILQRNLSPPGPGSPAAVPEPSAAILSLVVIGLAGFLTWRRKGGLIGL